MHFRSRCKKLFPSLNTIVNRYTEATERDQYCESFDTNIFILNRTQRSQMWLQQIEGKHRFWTVCLMLSKTDYRHVVAFYPRSLYMW